jgi:hypothetical protein
MPIAISGWSVVQVFSTTTGAWRGVRVSLGWW